MNHIIKELIDNGYNITKTDDPNIYEYTSQGVTLEMNTKIEPDTWSYSDPNVPIHAKNDFDDVISIYKRTLEKKKAALDDVDFSMAEEPNGYKNGGYKSKVRNTEPEKFENIMDAEYEPMEEQLEVELPDPGNEILDLECSLCRIGNIKMGKKGELRKSNKGGRDYQLPEKLNHFVVTSMEKGSIEKDGTTDFKTDTEIMKILGPEPKSLKIRLVHDEINKNLRTSYARYKSAVCECRGDGRTAKLRNGKKIVCKGRNCEFFKETKCKMNGVLNVLLEDAPIVGGVYQLRTTSVHSISNLRASMMQIQRGTCGLLAYLPLLLTISPKSVTLDNGTTTDIYVANIVYRGSLEDMITAAKQTIQLRESMRYNVSDYELLAERTEVIPESEDERKAVCEEFYGGEALKGV